MDDVVYERVTLASTSPFVLSDVGRRAPRTRLIAHYFRPATDTPPFPGVVVCQSVGGLKGARDLRYGRFLAQNGCAALVIDSFAARGYGRAPTPIRAIRVTESMMLADTFASLAWLSRRPEVDGERISNIGFSDGGMVCLLTAYNQIASLFAPDGERFRAHVSYYGLTVPRLVDNTTTGAAIAMFSGAKDDSLDPTRFDLIAQDLQSGGSAVEKVTFPSAFHGWDAAAGTRALDRFNLRALAMQIDPDNTTIHEPSGMMVRGLPSRIVMIARSVSLKGVHRQPDANATRTTDQILIRYAAGRHGLPGPTRSRQQPHRRPPARAS